MRNVRAMALDVVGECGCANGKDQIVAVKQGNDSFANGGKESGEQRMIFGKPATSAHRRCPDTRVMSFGEADDVVEGVVAVDRRACNKYRTFALIECVADLVH